MREEGVAWNIIAERVGKKKSTCQMHWARMQDSMAAQAWDEENDKAFKNAYQKKKGDMWNLLAHEMGFQGNWKILEAKAFEFGRKGLK